MVPNATKSVVLVMPLWDDMALSLGVKWSLGNTLSLASIVTFVRLVLMSGRRRGVRLDHEPSDRI